MSSILDALKKAEQESTTERGVGTPWPAPLPAQAPHRHTTRWWLTLGMVVAVCIFGVFFWQARRPGHPRPGVSTQAAPPSGQTRDSATPPVALNPKPKVAVVEKNRTQPETTVLQATAPLAAAPLVHPVKKPPQAATPPAASPPAPLPLEKKRPPTAAAKSDPVAVSPVAPIRPPADAAETTGQPQPEPPAREKNLKNDPRIDLQALVWAPDAAVRFVVINNRLIKEGGSVDNIVVVQINQDDVLLSEGSDWWYEEFSVR